MATRFIIILIALAFAEYYSFIVVRSAVRTVPSGGRIALLTLYIILTLLTWTGFFLFRQLNWANIPHMVRNIYIAFTMGFIVGKLLLLPVMLVDDIRRLVMWIGSLIFPRPAATDIVINTGKGISRSVFLQRLALGIGGTVLGAFLYGITNRYNYKVKRIKISFDNLPQAFRGMKIVQVSDIHSGSFDSHRPVELGIQKVLDEKPDLILFTGDLVNNRSEEIQPYVNAFSKFIAPLGVFSTLGNHDYGDYEQWPSPAAKVQNLNWLKQTHAKMGWRLLMNEHVILQRGEDRIALVGIENWGAKAGFPKYGKMDVAYQGLPEKNIPFKILMSHDPSHWDAQVLTDYPDIDLTLSGHTHGMQFGVEIPGFKWSPVQYVYKKWAGLYQEGKQYLYVNRGFGFLGYPGRLGILPEITVIELV